MYAYQSSQQAEPDWEYPPVPGSDIGRLNSALPKPPTYLPPPVPPAGSIFEFNRPQRMWFKIPSNKPVLTIGILALLVIIYVPTAFFPQFYEWAVNTFALNKYAIIDGEWWRLFTATLLHWNIPIHILLNGSALYIIGRELEGFFGHKRFAAIYLVSALGGSVGSFIFSPAGVVTRGGIEVVTGIGASGAVFGLIGALGVYYGINRYIFGKIGAAQFWNIIIVIVLNLGLGFSGIFPIDNSAHVGGLIAGAVIGFVLCPRYSLGEWMNPLVRRVTDTNKSTLAWIAAALVGLAVVLLFFVVLLLYKQGYIFPVLTRG